MKARLARLAPYDDRRSWLRGLGVSLVAAAFLTLSGAFQTGEAPLPLRTAYWLLLMVAGQVWGACVARLFFRPGQGRSWLRILAASAAIAAPFTLVVAAGNRWILGSSAPASELPMLFVYVLAVSIALTAINALIERRNAAPEAAPPKFLDRLPLRLRGAELWAVEAQDHYLRLHTSKGQDLILMRLADAVAELEGIEGLQVHRSWWVARDAIVAARRGDGRATLTLKDGAEIPVSRTYAGELRTRGWI